MLKRGFLVSKLLLFAVALAFAVISSTSVFAPFTECQVTTSDCSANEVDLFHLSNNANAHAQLATKWGYSWNVCCKLTGAGQDRLDTSCASPDTKVTALSYPTNAHVERPGESDYPEDVCLSAVQGTVLCTTVPADCSSEERCVFTQSDKYAPNPYTNAHAADCVTEPYALKNCCRYYPQDCGGLNEPCCAGSCASTPSDPLQCVNNVCVPRPTGPTCGDSVCDAGEADPASPNYCPADCGASGPATVWGYVTNVTGDSVEGATVAVVGKAGASDLSDAVGYYEISVNNPADGSPYGVVASLAPYESSVVEGVVLADWDSVQLDFLLLRPAEGCNADCTKADGRCHAECGGKGLCVYKSQEIADACDFSVPGLIDDPSVAGNDILCCVGGSFTPVKANARVDCGGDVVSMRIPVVFRGKFASMVVTAFDAAQCRVGFVTGRVVGVGEEFSSVNLLVEGLLGKLFWLSKK